MAIRRETYQLTNDNIDLISANALDEMDSVGISAEHKIKTRFSLEEALLRMQEHFGEDAVVAVSSFRRIGRHYIEVRLRGDAYNPLRFSVSEYEEWNQILSYADYQPDFQYSGHTNLVRWSAPVEKKHPAIVSAAAILIGLLSGLIGKTFSSNPTAFSAILAILKPVEEIWIRLLNVLCGPVIFLLIITTVMNMDSITRQGDSTARFLTRIFRMSLLSSVFALLTCIAVFSNIHLGGFRNTASDFEFLLLELVPEDVVTPFASSNVPQLLLLGIVLGSALVASGKKYHLISGLIQEANGLGLRIAEWMSNTAPVFLAVLIAYEIINNETELLIYMWEPVLLFIGITFVIMALATILTARIEGMSPLNLARALTGPFVQTIKSGSADPVFKYTFKNCCEKLGIDEKYAEAALKIGLIMYMPVTAAGTLIFVIYTASRYNVNPTFMWYVMAVVVAIAMSVAVPPVPGVGILTYVVMFAQLGLPDKALIAAMVFDVLSSLIIAAANQYLLQLELIVSADRMAMLDRGILRSDSRAAGKAD